MCRLDDEELLDAVTGGALVHAVPGGVGEGAADSPEKRDGSFSRVWER